MRADSKEGFAFPNIFGTETPEIGRGRINPASPIVATGTTPQVFHVPSQFGGYAIDVSIDNLDAVGTVTFRINSRSSPVSTISPSGVFTLNDVQVVLLEIVTGTNYVITFNIVPLPKGV